MFGFTELKYKPKSPKTRINFHPFPAGMFVSNTVLPNLLLIVCSCFSCEEEQAFAPMGTTAMLNIWRSATNHRKRSRWFPDIHVLLIIQCSLSPLQPWNSFHSLLFLLILLASRLQTKCLLPVCSVVAKTSGKYTQTKSCRESSPLSSSSDLCTHFWEQTKALMGLQLPATMAYHMVQPQLRKQHL